MLTQEPVAECEDRRRGPASTRTRVLLTLIVLGVITLRHDFWWWDVPGPLLFGFLPAGLWWQGLVSLLAAGMMWLMVQYAWPGHLEREVVSIEEACRSTPARMPASGDNGQTGVNSGNSDLIHR